MTGFAMFVVAQLKKAPLHPCRRTGRALPAAHSNDVRRPSTSVCDIGRYKDLHILVTQIDRAGAENPRELLWFNQHLARRFCAKVADARHLHEKLTCSAGSLPRDQAVIARNMLIVALQVPDPFRARGLMMLGERRVSSKAKFASEVSCVDQSVLIPPIINAGEVRISV